MKTKNNKVILLISILFIGLVLFITLNIFSKPHILWKIDSKNMIGGIVLKNEIIYVPTLDNYFEAIDAKSGIILWRYATDSLVLYPSKLSSNSLAFVSKNGTIYEIDPITGEDIATSQRLPLTAKDFTIPQTQDLLPPDSVITIHNTDYHIKRNVFFPDISFLTLFATYKGTHIPKWSWPEDIGTFPYQDNNAIYFMSGNYLYSVQ